MKNIMVIGGGDWQIPLVKKCKDLGASVVNSNLYQNSPAFKYADYCEVADILDIEKNLEIAHRYKLDAIITDQSDIAVKTVAYLNEKLGLNGIGINVAENFTNKYKMRLMTRQLGIQTPNFILCEKIEELLSFLKLNNKIVIKPLSSQSSRGVFTIKSDFDRDEIKNLFEETVRLNNNKTPILAEAFIDGVEFTVDGIKYYDNYETLAISEKIRYSEDSNVASALFFSHKNKFFDYENLKKLNLKIINGLGLPFGLTHAEYIFREEDKQFYLVEVAARGGGTNISSHIVPIMSGVDNMELFIKMALREVADIKKLMIDEKFRDRCCILQFFKFKEGRVKNINGIQSLKNIKNVLDYKINIEKGEYIEAPTDDSKRAGYFIAYADNENELRNIAEDILEKVKVEYE